MLNEYEIHSVACLFAAGVLDRILTDFPAMFYEEAQFQEMPLADMDEIKKALRAEIWQLRERGKANQVLAAMTVRLQARRGGML